MRRTKSEKKNMNNFTPLLLAKIPSPAVSIICSIILFNCSSIFGQIWNGQDSLYGNEWIMSDQEYFKLDIAEDGIYRISKSELVAANFPVNTIKAENFQLYSLGNEIPIYVTSSGLFQTEDYLEFYGEKNRSELDQHLFNNPDDQLNPKYSLFSDTAAYYLTYSVQNIGLRFTNMDNNLTNPGPSIPYYLHNSQEVKSSHGRSWRNDVNVRYSNFDSGEGFAGSYLKNQTVNLPMDNYISAGPDPLLDMRLASDLNEHDLQIQFNNNVIFTKQFQDPELIAINQTINSDLVTENNAITISGLLQATDKYALAYASLIYPRAFDCQNQTQFNFKIPQNPAKYLEVENFSFGNTAPILYDLTNQNRIIVNISNDLVQANIGKSNSEREVILFDNNAFKTIANINKVNFPNLLQSNANYIIITHPELNNDNGGTNPIADYVEFRESSKGGNYDVQVVSILDLYELFSFGIQRHPIAIRNFTNYILKNWSAPEMIFLVGKAREYSQARKPNQLLAPENASFHIPTFGIPGSDNLLVGRQYSNTSSIPVGRLAASNKEQIAIYLQKIKELTNAQFEGEQTIENRSWMKEIIHLASGDVTIQQYIRNSMEGFENIIEEDGQFGGHVNTFFKNNSDPIQISVTQQIFDKINFGSSLITFFGHSSPGTFDFNIDNPDNYSNRGKYPLLISLGCYSGNIHLSEVGISERFVFYENKGASSFLATSGPGYITTNTVFGNSFYESFGKDQYGKPLGEIIRESLKPLTQSPNFKVITFVQQLTLNGDPALVLNPRPGPDYIVDHNEISFSPETLDNSLDQFKLSFDVVNLGRNSIDSFNIEIYQEYPNGQKELVANPRIPPVWNRNTISVDVNMQEEIASGLNKFFIHLDGENEIEELPTPGAELNNELQLPNGNKFIEYFIYDASANPISPCRYGIHSDSLLTLRAYTNFVRNSQRSFLFEIDTSSEFNSSALESTSVLSDGGLIEWTPSNYQNYNNSIFYWRVAPKNSSNIGEYSWKQSSFLFNTNLQPGWNQSSQKQQENNQFSNIEFDSNGEYKFIDDFLDIRVINKVIEGAAYPEFQFNGNNFTEMFWPFPTATLRIAVFDEIGQFWKIDNPAGPFDVENPFPGQPPLITFIWQTDTPERRSKIMDFLQNTIPDNHTVVVYTSLRNYTTGADLSLDEWANDSIDFGQNLFQVMEGFGATEFRKMESIGTRPYTYVFKKGEGKIKEDLAIELTDILYTEHSVQGLWTEGSVKSTFIGPAQSWDRFEFELDNFDNFINDNYYFNIFGAQNAIVDSTILLDSITGPVDLSMIDANTYPYLRIEFHTSDEIDKSASYLKSSTVYYKERPEFVLHPNEQFTFSNDTLNQGEQFQYGMLIKNIGETADDSTTVDLIIRDETNNDIEYTALAPPIQKGASYNYVFDISTTEVVGRNSINFEINKSKSILEKSYLNNFHLDYVTVNKDNTPPLLDVTFDGVKIMNGDLVSARPEIIISLKDENEIFPINDTSNLKMFLVNPDKRQTLIPFDSPNVEFIPASGNKNEATVRIVEYFPEDGTYKLIVQGKDASNNSSGNKDYIVSFKIINEKTISNVVNYPNPFSSSTRFVYTLTGDRAPAQYKIQIFTISGKLVNELTQNDLGILKVGTHQTEYAWDGTDDYGDRLATGIYLYRMITVDENTQDYKKSENERIDKFFKNGFNKLAIIR